MSEQQEFPAELVERAARAIWGGAFDAMLAEALSWGDDPNVTSAHFEVRSMRESALAALRALRDAGALVGPDQVAVPRKLLTEAHACMRETGWHLATCEIADAGYVTDGVLEAACHEIEGQFAGLLAAAPRAGGGSAYMGQIMAECGCPREAECQAAGRCIAGGGDE